MRYFFSALAVLVFFASCNKEKYTSAPQIKFKSITPAFYSNNTDPRQNPFVTIEVTDAEGDFGYKEGKDTSYIFIKNITLPPFVVDSFLFPEALTGATHKNFKGDVEVSLGDHVAYTSGGTRPYTDTLYFEIYVRDFAKNKSNVIKTDNPLLFITP